MEYSFVTRAYGQGRFSCMGLDGVERQAGIRGIMRNREFIRVGDFCLVQIYDFNANQATIAHKYSVENVRDLKQRLVLPEAFGAAVAEGADGLGDIFCAEDASVAHEVDAEAEAEAAGGIDIDGI